MTLVEDLELPEQIELQFEDEPVLGGARAALQAQTVGSHVLHRGDTIKFKAKAKVAGVNHIGEDESLTRVHVLKSLRIDIEGAPPMEHQPTFEGDLVIHVETKLGAFHTLARPLRRGEVLTIEGDAEVVSINHGGDELTRTQVLKVSDAKII